MKVLVTGATGLVGKKLCTQFNQKGFDLTVIGTQSESKFRARFSLPCEYITWETLDTLSEINLVYHLAGEPIASGRWTSSKKNSILNSRTKTTEKLISAFKKGHWPRGFIGASAIGYYGNRGDEILHEESAAGDGFLSEVCQKWEESAKPIKNHSSVAHLRIGIVLAKNGGFLKPMESLFSKGLGGPVGDGTQWMSWIHIDDLVNILIQLGDQSATGIFNGVSPKPVTNEEWTKAYAKQLRRPALFRAPAFALKWALGEMSHLALDSQRVSCDKVLNTGFEFEFPTIEEALKNLYSE